MAIELPLEVWQAAGVNLVRTGAAPAPAPRPMLPKPAGWDRASAIVKRTWLLEAKREMAKADGRAAYASAASTRPGYESLSPVDKLTVQREQKGRTP